MSECISRSPEASTTRELVVRRASNVLVQFRFDAELKLYLNIARNFVLQRWRMSNSMRRVEAARQLARTFRAVKLLALASLECCDLSSWSCEPGAAWSSQPFDFST